MNGFIDWINGKDFSILSGRYNEMQFNFNRGKFCHWKTNLAFRYHWKVNLQTFFVTRIALRTIFFDK